VHNEEEHMEAEAPALTRVVDGKEVPAVGTWVIDPTHTQAEFVARHLMVTKVRGGFADVSGTIEVAEDPKDSKVEVIIDVATVSSGTDDRDAHLRSADFFDVEAYPEMRFVSTSVEPSGSSWKLTGDLTIKDITRPVTLDFEFLGISADPWGNAKAAFSASTEVAREDWNLTWNVPLEGGGVLVSKQVKLEIEVQAALQG
jgi:polyisoprenoid-binding protein YceI